MFALESSTPSMSWNHGTIGSRWCGHLVHFSPIARFGETSVSRRHTSCVKMSALESSTLSQYRRGPSMSWNHGTIGSRWCRHLVHFSPIARFGETSVSRRHTSCVKMSASESSAWTVDELKSWLQASQLGAIILKIDGNVYVFFLMNNLTRYLTRSHVFIYSIFRKYTKIGENKIDKLRIFFLLDEKILWNPVLFGCNNTKINEISKKKWILHLKIMVGGLNIVS